MCSLERESPEEGSEMPELAGQKWYPPDQEKMKADAGGQGWGSGRLGWSLPVPGAVHRAGFQGRHSDCLSLNKPPVWDMKVHALGTCNSQTTCLRLWPVKTAGPGQS